MGGSVKYILCLAALLYGAMPAVAGAAPLGLKAFVLGMTMSEFKQAYRGRSGYVPGSLACDTDGAAATCTNVGGLDSGPTGDTIAGAAAKILYAFGRVADGTQRLEAITAFFDHSDFDSVVSALTSKYGPPSVSNKGVASNSFGAAFADRTFTWEMPGSQIVATERVRTLTESAVMFSTTAARKRARDGAAAEERRRAADL